MKNLKRIAARWSAAALAGWLVCSVGAAEGTATRPEPAKPAQPTPLAASPDAKLIAQVTAQVLQYQHYSRRPFDESVSTNWLKGFIEDLDPQRMHFLQSDVDAFAGYRERLDKLTLRGDTTPGNVIFSMFLLRLTQRVDYCIELLKTETFDFTGQERATMNRKDLGFPATMAEARQLWRERLRAEYLQEKLNKEKTEKIVDTLTRRYQRIQKTFKDFDADNVLELYLTSLAHVYDPHSDYMGKSQIENFAIQMNLSLFGIGAELRSEDGICKINRLLPGPAEKSGQIKVNDKITAVAQGDDGEFVDIVDMPLNKAVQLIRGPKGSTVRLQIEPGDAKGSATRKIVTIVRDEIKFEDQAAKGRVYDLPTPAGAPLRVGVIDLPSFYHTMDIGTPNGRGTPRSTTTDVAKLLRKFEQEGVKGVILDLRRNGGGSLEEAIALTGLFVKDGPVVQVKDWNGRIVTQRDNDSTITYDGPLVVLTSRHSASASEIVAGALQDYGRALLVGEQGTHGKGTVQQLLSIKDMIQGRTQTTNDPGALKLTIRKFYRASGKATQLKGVLPDIVLPAVNNVAEIGESALDNPLPYDEIAAASFEPLGRAGPFLPELRRRSESRVAQSREFDYVREDMALYKKLMADKTVSLNEAERLKEKDENEARAKARDKERLARAEPERKVYELTLKLCDDPGLPPPMAKTNTVTSANADEASEASDTLATTDADGDSKGGPDAKKGEPKAPSVDAALDETLAILADYLNLLPASGFASTAKPAKATTTDPVPPVSTQTEQVQPYPR